MVEKSKKGKIVKKSNEQEPITSENNEQEPITSENNEQEPIVAEDNGSAGNWSLDLWIVMGITISMLVFIYVQVLNGTIIRPVLAALMVLFVPGYALVAVIFPGKKDLAGILRFVLSFGLSISVVPLIGFALNFTPWGVRLDPIVIGVTMLTMACVILAYFRRRKMAEDERYSIDYSSLFDGLKNRLFSFSRPLDLVLNVTLILAIIACIGVVAFVVTVPKQSESYTLFYVLGPEGKTAFYPTSYVLGEKKPVIVNVVNHEHRSVTHDLVINLEDNNTTTRLFTEKVKIEDNQTWTKQVFLKPDRLGTNMKLEFLLYADGDTTAPYRECLLWITVTNQSAVSVMPIKVNTTTPIINNTTNLAGANNTTTTGGVK